MNRIWYKQLGFYNNPFSIKPAAFHDNLFGYEDLVARVIKSVDAGNFVFIEGEYGRGKTTILKHLLRYFGGHKKVIYFSVNRVEKRMQIRRLLNERYGRIGKWFDIRPKDMILLLDEVQEMDGKDVEKMLKFQKEGNFKSIVFVGQKYNETNFPANVAKNLKLFKLENMTENDAVSLIRKRIGKLEFFNDNVIKKIFVMSHHNARAMLKNCEILCRKAVDYGSEKITDKMLEEFFGEVVSVQEEPKDEKIFLELDEEAEEDFEEEVEKTPVKKTKKKFVEDISEDVAVEDSFEKDKKYFGESDEIDEELSRMEMEEEAEEEKEVNITNGVQDAVAAEEALGKDAEDILDKHYY